MFMFIQRIRDRRNQETGASAVEYGLLVAAIAAVIVIIVFALGKLVKGGFESTCSNIATDDDDTTTSAATSC